ncbi:MAG: hypothetical protein PVJ21_02155 [Anaerolineales bacterium]
MMNSFHSTLTQSSRTLKLWLIFLLILSSNACQSEDLLSPTSTLQSTLSPPTGTEPGPTALPTSSPLAAIELTPTKFISPLSPDGPWLIYTRRDELVIINQDGTGQIASARPTCDFYSPPSIQEDLLNRIAILSGRIYLIQPLKNVRALAYSPWPPCHTAFTGDTEGGLLAKISHLSTKDSVPELIIYELPSGKIRDRFLLVKCSDQIECAYDHTSWWEIKWSPNGRYLAFPAIWGGPSTDLYVYDSENGSTRQLTSGPDDVAQIEWTPDGKWIIMGEVAEAFRSSFPGTTSLWAVSVSNNDIHLIHSFDYPFPIGILGWIDNERFVIYNGTSLYNALDLPAENLRLVDLRSNTLQTIFDGFFMTVDLDAANQTIVLYGGKRDDEIYKHGTHLIFINNGTDQYMGGYQAKRNETLGLYVMDAPCEDEPNKFQAFDTKGKLQCVKLPLQPDYSMSPNGEWQISLQGGVQLVTKENSVIPVSEDFATQITWCPNSKCFFVAADNTLYHVTIPDVTIQTVDELLGMNEIDFQWLSK